MLSTIIKEARELFSNKRIWIVLITVLIILIIGTYYNMRITPQQAEKPLKMGVVNNDSSTYSRVLLDYFKGSKVFSGMIEVTTGMEEVVRQLYEEGELDVYVEIPEGFSENMIHIEHIPIKVYISIEDTTKAIIFTNILQGYEKYIAAVEANAVGLYDIMTNDGMDNELVDKANTEISMNLILTALGKEAFFTFVSEESFPAVKITEYYLISILVMVIFFAGLYGGFKLLREIRQHTFIRLITTQMPLYRYLAAKTILYAAALSIFALSAASIINSKMPDLGIALICISSAVFSVTFSLFLSCLFTTEQRYILAGNLIMFIFSVMGGGIIPIMFLPRDILRVSKLTPFYYAIEGLVKAGRGYRGKAVSISLVLMLVSLISFVAMVLFYTHRRADYEEA